MLPRNNNTRKALQESHKHSILTSMKNDQFGLFNQILNRDKIYKSYLSLIVGKVIALKMEMKATSTKNIKGKDT
jgi:hypothetical protein